MDANWHPRGEVTYPNWKSAQPGDRVEHVRSHYRGTVVHAIVGTISSARYLVVDWDDVGFGITRGRVVAPAFDLKPVEDGS